MNHQFDIDDAVKYGIKEAILLANLKFWIAKNSANQKHFYDGQYWTYNSVKAWQQLFPYFTEKQIRTALESLVSQGAVLTGCYNDTAYNRTKWFALKDNSDCHKQQIHLPSRANQIAQNGKTTNTTDINTDINTDKESASAKPSKPIATIESFTDGLNMEAWTAWVDYRKKIGKALKPASLQAAQKAMALFGDDQMAVVQQSIANGYQGLFAIKKAQSFEERRIAENEEKLRQLMHRS